MILSSTQGRNPPQVRACGDLPNIASIASSIAHLGSGPLAALRRGPLEGAGCAAFWQIMASHRIEATDRGLKVWAAIVQAIAILTPRGRAEGKLSAHNPGIKLGSALCEAGISDLRLARLLSSKGAMRQELMIRQCRRLAASGNVRFDMFNLARFLLFERSDRPAQKIAESYYRSKVQT